jgi:hypothetical protein
MERYEAFKMATAVSKIGMKKVKNCSTYRISFNNAPLIMSPFE